MNEVFNIGIIDFDEYNFILTEEEISDNNSRPNFKGSVGKCKVEVYGGEGPIPHFHILKPDKSFQMCALIYSANYFSHGGKYTDTLNKPQRKILDNWLNEQNTKYPDFTNWEAIAFQWNLANQKWSINRSDKVKPDYTEMNTFKDK